MIYFVGAGCGAADLITVRGKKLIENADIIIYAGSLVNPEILGYSSEKCKIFNSAEMTLEQIIDVMEKAESENKNTVRLHTGDPSIYGALKEQTDMLDKKGIKYEICPGVSSMFGAAASLNAEYTLPGVSQTVIITRREGRTPVPENERISALASHKASMVIFLSANMLERVSYELMEGGYSPDTPAALAYKVTCSDEKIIRTTVSGLPKAGIENNIKKTALIIVGDFLKNEYERSNLYNPAFSHEFRKGNQI